MEVNTAVRAICPDIIINNTSGGSKKRTHDGSVSPPATASIAAKPEIASLDAVNLIAGGDAQLRLPPIGRPIDTHLTKSESDAVVAFMKENGCKPEYMCYGSGDFEYLNEFINAGLPGFDGPHWIQLVCTGNTIHAKIDSICKAIDSLPDNSILGIISGGDTQWGVLAAAITMGAHVRVGMEDNMYLANGEMADSNARLVEKIVRIARDIGRPIATPTQARDMLGLDKPRQYK
jgi:3-keto-5-aminohexanoate cleavage enzyme